MKIHAKGKKINLTIIAIIILAILTVITYVNPINTSPLFVKTAITILLIITVIILVLQKLKGQRKKEFEKNLIKLIYDMATISKIDSDPSKIFTLIPATNYGPLKDYIKKIKNDLFFGKNLSEAIKDRKKKIKDENTEKTIGIISKALEKTDNIEKILYQSAEILKEKNVTKKEITKKNSTYILVIYGILFIFLILSLMLNLDLNYNLFTQNFFSNYYSNNPIYLIFSWAITLQIIGSGLLAGFIENGKTTTGLKHIAMMIILSIATLTFFS
ncbi:MAG: type II secretion system F family protein [Candidatus Thermoplasmatota archaeon]